MGSLDLEIPRLRDGAYMPSFLEHRTRSERVLIALVQEAVVGGVSTRKVQKLVAELGITSLSKSQVSEFCIELDAQARAFRERPLTGNYPYLFLDAVFEKICIGRTVVSQACVIAYGVREDGVRELNRIGHRRQGERSQLDNVFARTIRAWPHGRETVDH